MCFLEESLRKDSAKKTEYEGSDELTLYLDEIKGISTKQIEILSKAEIHTAEDYLKIKDANIISLKGMGVKTVAKIKKLVNDATIAHTEKIEKKNADAEILANKPVLEEIDS